MNGPPVLRIRGVSKRFGGAAAVRELDLEIAPGEYFCILGPSGSGKTTLLRLLAGFLSPDEGEIHLAGERVDGLPPERRDANTVFQGYALFPHLSVFENVAFGLRMKGRRGADLEGPVLEALTLVGLGSYGPRAPASLSGGEQQRVALARALVNRPRILLLDEPLAALDRKLRIRMQGELARIQRESGIAFVHVTHDQEEALRLADRLAVMEGGRFLQVGPPGELYDRPGSAFVAGFLGAANLIRARATPEGFLLADGTTLSGHPVDGGEAATTESGPERLYAVRPEALRVVTDTDAAGVPRDPAWLRMEVVIERLARVGGVDEIVVRAGESSLTVHRTGRPLDTLRAGDRVSLCLHRDDVVPLREDRSNPDGPVSNGGRSLG